MTERPEPLVRLDGYFAAARSPMSTHTTCTASLSNSTPPTTTPQLATLRARQGQIIAELLDLLGRTKT